MTPLEMKRVADVEGKLSAMAKPPEEPTTDFSMASISELRLLTYMRALLTDLRTSRKEAPAPDPLVELACRLVAVSSVRPSGRASPPLAVEKVRAQAEALLAGTLVPPPAPRHEPAPRPAAPPAAKKPEPTPAPSKGREWSPIGSLGPFRATT